MNGTTKLLLALVWLTGGYPIACAGVVAYRLATGPEAAAARARMREVVAEWPIIGPPPDLFTDDDADLVDEPLVDEDGPAPARVSTNWLTEAHAVAPWRRRPDPARRQADDEPPADAA